MQRVARLGLALAALSCRHSSTPTLAAAGTATDEGHGELARASSRMLTNDEAEPGLAPTTKPTQRREESSSSSSFDEPALSSGSPYGGATYANYSPPPWTYSYISRQPTYQLRTDLSGAIEGTITWRGASPKFTTACGDITPISVGKNHALAGAIVYIDKVLVGRMTGVAGEQRPSTVGGVVVKRGCSLLPAAQVVAPVPAQLTINGDATATRIRIASPNTSVTELQEGGRITLPLGAGTTVIESEDGSLAAAFVLGITSPAYTLTDDTGHFRLDELANGTYEVIIWHPAPPKLVGKKLVYDQPIITRRRVKVTDRRTTRLDVTVDATR